MMRFNHPTAKVELFQRRETFAPGSNLDHIQWPAKAQSTCTLPSYDDVALIPRMAIVLIYPQLEGVAYAAADTYMMRNIGADQLKRRAAERPWSLPARG